ncbi:MAG: nucleoside deaminase [Clostridiales bacterium]|nr:nucleoside deaminase [Clostridiales bacterium]
MTESERLMREALSEAKLAEAEGEIPVGAVLARGGEIVARAHNRRETAGDPTAHAEILALRAAAAALGRRRLSDCTLYVTLEPCPMCAGAMVMASLGACVFGAADTRQGCCESVYALANDPAFSWRLRCAGGLLAEESQELLRRFFQRRRNDAHTPQDDAPTNR